MANDLHIGFCVNAPYVPYLCVAVRSIADTFSSGAKAHIHVFTDSMDLSCRRRLAVAADNGRGNICLQVHEVDDTPLRGLKEGMYTLYAWYRLLIPAMLPDVGKMLYLDTDVCVADDLSPLAEVDLDGCALAVPDDTDSYTDAPYARCGYPRELGYFCSGVMLLNLDYWRSHNVAADVMEWARTNASRLKYPDQDSINYVCRHAKRMLPLRYGVTKSVFTQPTFYNSVHARDLLDCLERPAVIHYAGCAPWFRESEHPMAEVWRKVNAELPSPASLKCRSAGMLALKIRLWDMLHPSGSRAAISPAEIRERLSHHL